MRHRPSGTASAHALSFCALVVLMSTAACGGDPAAPPVAGAVTGTVYTVDGSAPSGLYVRWTTDAGSTSQDVPANGRFSLPAATGAGVELLIDQHGTRTVHPFLYPFSDAPQDIAVVLVPRQWTIRKGIHAGQKVPISLDLVMDEPTGGTYYNVFRPLGSEDLGVDFKSLSADVLPFKVAIDHTYGPNDRPFSATDSATMWAAFNRMETVFGENLFEPVNAQPSWITGPSRNIPGVILVRKLDGTIANAVIHTTPAAPDWRQELGTWAGGGFFTGFELRRGWVESGEILIGNTSEPPMGWPIVYTHEMLHIVGVGHTSRIPSPQGPAMRTSEPSAHDVAYIEMMRELLLLDQQHNTSYSLMPAMIGERRVMLGLPALPQLQWR